VPSTPSPTELIKMRSAWDDWLVDKCDITRSTTTEGDYGQEETEEVVAANVPAGTTSTLLPGVQQLIADQLSQVADAAVTLPFGTDVQVADNLIVTSQNDRNLEVLYVTFPGGLDAGIQAYCREIK
jgi:hypothetical protein